MLKSPPSSPSLLQLTPTPSYPLDLQSTGSALSPQHFVPAQFCSLRHEFNTGKKSHTHITQCRLLQGGTLCALALSSRPSSGLMYPPLPTPASDQGRLQDRPAGLLHKRHPRRSHSPGRAARDTESRPRSQVRKRRISPPLTIMRVGRPT
ncbi:hypothetical protein BD413DRAFT_305448 [Trametes elegans]|nr:hypothetical protein BD413DRAFT_305448 [Trametes elegans]